MKTFTDSRGITTIEMVAILIVVGILSAVAVSKLMNSDAEIIGRREVIKNHIRYSQIMAMKSNTVCGMIFNGSTYSIFRNGSTADKISLPGTDGTDFSIPTGLGTCNETIYFDLWGTPYSDAGLTSQRSSGGLGSLGITMTADTGYIN